MAYDIPTEIILQQVDKKKIFPTDDPVKLNQLRITDIALFSTTPPQQAKFTTDIIRQYYDKKTLRNMTITDTSACIGGNVYAWLEVFGKINFIEISNLHVEIFKNNLKVLFPKNKTHITIYNENYLAILNIRQLKQDVIFMDPPWGGVDYYRLKNIDLYYNEQNGQKISVSELINKKLYNRARMILLKVPFNYNFNAFDNSPFKYKERIPLLKNNGSNVKSILYEIIVLSHDPIQFPNEKLKTTKFPALGYRYMKYSAIK